MTDKSKRNHPASAHSTSELTRLLPELVIPAADIASCNDSWRLASLTDKGRRAAGNTLEIIDALAKRYERMAKILSKGGTFNFNDIDLMLVQDRVAGNLTQAEVEEGRNAFDHSSIRLVSAVGEAVGRKLKKVTYKSYGPGKNGVGLHRDSAFPNNDTVEVASVGLRGANQFSVWAVPDSLELDVENSIGKIVDPKVGVVVTHEGELKRLVPVSTVTQAKGDIVHINEAQGVWVSDKLGPMSVWHSARRAHEHEPRLGAIIRSDG